MKTKVTHYTTYSIEDGSTGSLWMQDSADFLRIYQGFSLEVKKGTPKALELLQLLKRGVEILEKHETSSGGKK